MRVAVFVIPPVVFYVARAWCLGLQRADRERLLHGRETGVIVRAADVGTASATSPSTRTGPMH